METIDLNRVKNLQDEFLEDNPSWRSGQAYFNALNYLYPNIANRTRGTEYDMFYSFKNIEKFEKALKRGKI